MAQRGKRRGRSAVRPPVADPIEAPMNRLVPILFEHRKSNFFYERGRERRSGHSMRNVNLRTTLPWMAAATIPNSIPMTK